MTFEATLDRLHAIVATLEGETLPLDDALQLFEEGVARLRDAHADLARVDAKLLQLVEEADGSFALAEFAG